MIEIVNQIIKYYLSNKKTPKSSDLSRDSIDLLTQKWTIFVTLYKDWQIIWSCGNIVEIEKNIVDEIIENTVWALNDERFKNVSKDDFEKIRIRIDTITKRNVLSQENAISFINPIKNWVITIKKDYSKMAVILPNISSTLTNAEDLKNILSNKLDDDFIQENYIIYEIETEVETNF